MNDKINIGIWGAGVVGKATGSLFDELAKENVNVVYYDKFKNIGSKTDLLDKCDIIFLCVPTPMKLTGEICLDYINSSVEEISSLSENRKTIIIRSTAVSGSTDELSKRFTNHNFAFCPEFLTENNAKEDMICANKVVIGSDSDMTYEAIKSIFYYAYGDKVTYIKLTCKEAETLKYISNIFLAGQVMLSNELFFICKKIGVDYNKVQDCLKYDGRIGTHRKVPGPDNDYGIGGKCFPKDMSAFIYLAEQNNFDPKILKAMMEFNDKVRIKKDWIEIPGAVESNKNFKRD